MEAKHCVWERLLSHWGFLWPTGPSKDSRGIESPEALSLPFPRYKPAQGWEASHRHLHADEQEAAQINKRAGGKTKPAGLGDKQNLRRGR